jgi:hypothetical protein
MQSKGEEAVQIPSEIGSYSESERYEAIQSQGEKAVQNQIEEAVLSQRGSCTLSKEEKGLPSQRDEAVQVRKRSIQ